MLKMHQNALICIRMRMLKNNTTFVKKQHLSPRVNVHTTTRDNRYYGTVSARSEYTHTLSSLHDPILGGAGTHGHT